MKKNFFPLLMLLTVSINLYSQKTNPDSLVIGTKDRHQEMMDILFTPTKVPIKTIGILLYDGYNTLDAMGPYHTLAEIMGAKTFFVAKQRGFVKNQRGLEVKVDSSFEDIESLDILVIPGGAVETLMQTRDTVTLNWIKKIDKTTKYTSSVCTGAWILGAAGLLKDKYATTNWYRAEEVLKMYGAKFKEGRWIQDGKYWTSAGVSAGIDMSLAIIDDLLGRKYTESVMLDLEYDPKPPYNAGTPKKSDPLVADMMKEMYDMLMLPLINEEQAKKQNKPLPDPNKKIQTVEASCGQCQFKMKGKGCMLAVRFNGKPYFVDKAKIDDFGDAHDVMGFCNAIRKAKVQGEVVDGKFVASYFELVDLK